MKTNQTTVASGTDAPVLETIRVQQRRLKWLTGVAVAFWIAAVLACAGVMVCYKIFYKPKEQQIMADYEKHGHLVRHGSTPDGTPSKLTAEDALGIQFALSYAMTRGILAMAIAVTILSCGTLATLLLVVLNRRVTLRQINYSLAQISDQLRQLQARQ